MSDVERMARLIVAQFIVPASALARWESVAVLKRAIQIEQKSDMPRAAMIRVLRDELREAEHAAAAAPRDRA